MTETLPPLAQRFAGTAGLASFRARAARVRRAHAAAARDAVSSPRYTDLLLALGAAFARDDLPAFAVNAAPAATDEGEAAPRFDSPVGTFAAFVIDRRHRRIRKRGRRVPEAPPEERHRVRIAAKKLRYAAEFFAPLYPAKRVTRYVEALESLQDILGALNDAAVVDRLLAEVAAGGGRPTAPGIDGLVRGWVAAVAQHELARFRRAWGEFEAAKPFWA
jgi:inorganic triphosphatase YgiF